MKTGRRLALGMLLAWSGSCSPAQSIDRTSPVDEPGGGRPPINPEIAGTGGAGGTTPMFDAGDDEASAGGAGGGEPGGDGEPPGQGGATNFVDADPPPPPPDSPPGPAPVDAAPPPPPPPPRLDAAPVPEPPAVDAASRLDSAPPPMAAATVAFVVGNSANPSPGDRRLTARLIERGLRVRLVDHTRPAEALSNATLVLISASCASAGIGATFRAVALPVVSLEAFVFDDMGLTGAEKSVDYDEDQGTTIVITNGTHELAAGLGGSLIVAGNMANLAWGRPSAGAVKVAALTSSPAKTALFAYDRGTLMIGFPAPARRVGFFATETLSETLTDGGMALFDAAISWALR